jgi:vitamin B12 transporter
VAASLASGPRARDPATANTGVRHLSLHGACSRSLRIVVLRRSACCAAVTTLLSLLPLSALPALAADPPGAAADAGEVVVTATRQPVRADAQLSDVTVLTRADIEHAQGRTLAELLAQQPGVQAQANGGRGHTTTVSLRGNDARHTLLLIDGMRYGSASAGLASFENLPLDAIERIEIVRGPLSSLYGADAAGGVIQVFTRKGRSGVQPNAKLGVGPHGYREATAGVAAAQGAFNGALQLGWQRDHGFSATNEREPFGGFNPDDDGFRQTSVTASAGWRFSDAWSLNLQGLRSRGTSQYDDGPGADARARVTSESWGADLQGRVNAAWKTSVRLAQSTDTYDTLASASPFTDLGAFRTRQQQVSWENTVATPAGSLLLLAEHLTQKVAKPAAPFDVDKRHIDAVAVGLNGESGIHHWQGSLRHDRNSQFGHETTGNLAYGIDLAPAWRLGAAAGKSFVAPSFNQLYYPGFGNTTLLPERGRSVEANLRWRPSDEQQLTLTAYRQRVRDYITAANTNARNARLDGATLVYEGRVEGWQLGAAYDHLKARKDGQDGTLPRRAKNALKLSADRDAGAWSAGASVVAQSKRRDNAFDADFNAVPVDMPGYALLDLRADWRFLPDWTLQARLNNVGDRRYETAYGYNQPGRELFVALRWAPR